MSLQIDVLTIFPNMIDSYAQESILGRAQKKNLISIQAHNLRDYTEDKHKKVDDIPYGGGSGMVMKVEPFERVLKMIEKREEEKWEREERLEKRERLEMEKKTCVILTSPSGKVFTQKDAIRLSTYDHLIFLCGRYEGIDQRVEDCLVDETFSIGNYVLTGGELPSLVMIDAVSRHLPGVLGDEESLKDESHVIDGFLEYPQYTRPEIYVGQKRFEKTEKIGEVRKVGDGEKEETEWKVPEILLSGNHAEIEKWRMNESKKKSSKTDD